MKLLDNVLNRKQGEKMGYEDLSYEEVIVLIKQGNNFLVNELITRLEPVINKVARKFSTNHSILDDLIQRGRIATSKVIEKYDFNHESKSKFETYLNTCLRNEFKTAMSEISKHTGSRIRNFRKTRGLTLQQLADLIHKSRASISKYENGEITIDI
ncbi:MAG: helix-turn-helix domain-containing protein, partial [Clostridia bacterium]|nr:helix-turn-helix domain-containing protein [Clostridia bacterium]